MTPKLIAVAPMEGITTFPTRLWLHWTSAPAVMTTPFLRVTETFPGSEIPADFAPELDVLRGVLPYELIPQLLAANPEHFLRAAALIPKAPLPVIEINCGCPSPNSAGKTAGSGALRDPEWFARSLERLTAVLGERRLALKMRVGFDSPAEFGALLDAVAVTKLVKLTVHGRTRAEGYRGAARWDLIARATERAHCPTWGSGDVVDLASYALRIAEAPRVAGVIVGRGILANPWVCEELRTARPVAMDSATRDDALLSFALAHELWQRDPQKLIAKTPALAASGNDAAAWEKRVTTLAALVFGFPAVARRLPKTATVSNVALARLKMFGVYLDPRLKRTRSLTEFFEALTAR